MAPRKPAQGGEVIPRDFREQLEAAERQAATEYDPGSIGSDLSDDLALANTLAQIGEDESNAKVFVYKIDKTTKLEAFAFETTPTEFATGGLTEIGKNYGGGEYRIRVYADGKILTHKRIAIMEQKTANANPVQNIAADLQGLFSQQQATMMEGFKMLAESLRANQVHQPQAPSMMEQLQMFSTLQNMIGGNKSQTPDLAQMLDVLKQGMELGRSGGEQSMLDVLMRGIETFGPVITEAVKNGATSQVPQVPQMPQQIPPPIQTQISAPVPAVQLQQTQNEDEMGILQNTMMKQSITFLVKQAQSENDPETYANMVMDQMDNQTLHEFINRPDWLDFLANYNPAVKETKNAEWFNQLRSIIIEYLTDEPETGISSANAHTADTIKPAAVVADGNSTGEGGNS